jgi:glycine cleavage system H protein
MTDYLLSSSFLLLAEQRWETAKKENRRRDMETRKELLYSKSHEWLKIEGRQATVGITDYAQQAMGDVAYVELPKCGAHLLTGDVLSVIESIKAASEVYTPVSGTIVQVNQDLTVTPESVNLHPYESWIAVLELADPQQLEELMAEAAYLAFCAGEEA